MNSSLSVPIKPTLARSLTLFVVLVGAMAVLRLVVYRNEYVTLSYTLPVLVCLWYQERRLLWAMAAAFASLTTYKAWVVLPDFNPAQAHDLGQWVMQLANIVISAAVVHLVIHLMQSLRSRQAQLEQANSALATWERELAQQVESRTEELRRAIASLRALTMDLTQAEEQERRRIAQILHDSLQPLLVAARLQLKMLMGNEHNHRQLGLLQRADEILKDAIQESRTLTVQLTPPVLHETGLAEALTWLAEEMHRQHLLDVAVDLQAQGPPGHPTSILLFRCARELLLNVVKHAGVRAATVALRQSAPDILELEVSDDGFSFKENPAVAEASSGFGLFSIRERLKHLGGNMTLDCHPGRGTRIILQVPLPTQQETATLTRAALAAAARGAATRW